MHADFVVGKGHRPRPEASWPDDWTALMRKCWSADAKARPSFEKILEVTNRELDHWSSEGEDFMSNEEPGKDSDKIKARKSKSVFKIRARRDSQRLDIDTRLAKPVGPTERRHEATVV